MSEKKHSKAVFVNKGQRFNNSVASMSDYRAKRLVDQPKPKPFCGISWSFAHHEPDTPGAA